MKNTHVAGMHAPVNANSLKVFLCGAWDGVSLWAQWEDVAPELGYLLQVRLRPVGGTWEEWKPIGGLKPLRENWLVVPVWRQGWEAQAQVAVADPEPAYVLASEVTFQRSHCLFEISTEERRIHFSRGTEISTQVDGAGCTYTLFQEIELQPGENAECVAKAGALPVGIIPVQVTAVHSPSLR
ncbi:MAG TPA: hypothetical protein VF614_13450 [Chthoniobacteraceae bacterium]